MKPSHLFAFLGGILFLASAGPGTCQEQKMFAWSSAHFRVLTDSSVRTSIQIARKLEAGLSLYNGFLHYDIGALELPLQVRIFGDKETYDSYLNRLISDTRSDFVYISYNDPDRDELVGFQRDPQEFDASLLHYGFIQFLSAYVAAAPLWIEEGLATYLEYSQYDPATESFTWRANFAWLDALKKILSQPEITEELSLKDLLLSTKEQAQERIEVFYPTAWGLVHFLAQSPERDYNRILWESLDSLDAEATLEENSNRVLDHAFRWVGLAKLQSAFESYVGSLKTFNDLVRQGVDQYGKDSFSAAKSSFEKALTLRSDNYIPYYYLGLIAYQEEDFDVAGAFYQRAQQMGIDAALINYALGVNAFADRRYTQASNYLLKAKELDSESYTDKVDALLQRIDIMR